MKKNKWAIGIALIMTIAFCSISLSYQSRKSEAAPPAINAALPHTYVAAWATINLKEKKFITNSNNKVLDLVVDANAIGFIDITFHDDFKNSIQQHKIKFIPLVSVVKGPNDYNLDQVRIDQVDNEKIILRAMKYNPDVNGFTDVDNGIVNLAIIATISP